MDQLALSSLLLVLGALAYLASGILIVRALRAPGARAPVGLRMIALLGLVLHICGVATEMFLGDLIHFGFGMAVSAMLLIAVAITIIESFVHRINALTGAVLLVAAAGSVLPVVFTGTTYPTEEWSLLFRVHLLMALAAYSFMTIALVHAVLMALQNRHLKHPTTAETSFLDSMPGLVVMERIFFRIVFIGFLFLTAVLVTGAFATKETYGVFIHLDHKMILTWIAWALFGVLLLGRRIAGWRAKT